MTTLSEQLETIFQEIKTNFAQHQQIHVTPLAGDPPEQYRLIYHLQGLCKEEGGEVRPCTDHNITLTLPFGFPHFPPNCRPESPVFHPDFDQAAICIGEFWEINQSLSELIIHIGRMLCGEIYSTHNAFNEEAAVWYKENQERLPLDTIQQLPAMPTEPLSPPEEVTAPSSAPLTMDIIDDILFTGNETAETDEVEVLEQTETSSSVIAKGTSPHPHLILQDSSPPPPSPESNIDVDHQDQQELEEARQKHEEGENFEQQGQPAKALERYRAVKNLAPDFPEIDNDISRAQYSVEMLGDWVAGDSTTEESGNGKKTTASKLKKKQVAPPPPKKRTSRWPAIIIGCGGVGLLLALTFTYLFFNTQWEQAQTKFEECKQLVAAKRFPDAEQRCTDALSLTSKVLFIRQQEKKVLTEEIRQLQGSKEFKEGVASSTGGAPDNLPQWQQAMNLADKQLADARWQEALAGYTRALQLASEIPTFDRALLERIRAKRATAQFNISLQAGEQAMAGAEWDSAKSHFDQAMALARQNQQTAPAVISRLKSLTGQVEFNKLMAAGEGYFSQGEWKNALTAFEQARETERNFSFSDANTLTSLQEIIVRTKVYNSLEQGKKAFADAQWEQAINHYETAIQLLEENSEILRRDNPVESQQKISRLMLHAAIIRDKQAVASHLQNKAFTKAIDKMHALIETINMSAFAREEEFQAMIKETRISINQAQEDRLIAENISYLTNNYQKLFTQNNPSLVAENLSHPRITFLKKIGGKLLYQIQCFEQGQGRPVLLQTSYLYDPATRKWLFFNDAKSVVNEQKEKPQARICTPQRIKTSRHLS